MRRLFLEADDAPVLVGLDHAKALGRFRGINLEVATVTSAPGVDVLLQHLLVIHFVDVIAGQNEDVVRLLAADGINILIHRVGGAQIPVLRNAHLRRQHFDEFAKPHQRRPAAAHVPVQAQRFVLRENKYAAQIAVHAIRKRDVNDAVDAAKGHRRLGAIAGQRPKPFALAACQQILRSRCASEAFKILSLTPDPQLSFYSKNFERIANLTLPQGNRRTRDQRPCYTISITIYGPVT